METARPSKGEQPEIDVSDAQRKGAPSPIVETHLFCEFGHLENANIHKNIKFIIGINMSSENAPLYPALLTIFQSGIIKIGNQKNIIIQCQTLIFPIIFSLYKPLNFQNRFS